MPGAIAASLSVLEVVGEVADEVLNSTDSLWKSTLDAWQVMLERNTRPRQQAGCTPVCVIIALKMVVTNEVWPRHTRAISWLFLLTHWAVLCSDDCHGIEASCLSLTEVCLKGTLTKTKTTGPDRHTLDVPFFVSGVCALSGTDRLEVVFQIWGSTDYQIKGGFFILAENEDRPGPVNKMLPPETIIAFVRSVRAEYKLLNGAETVGLVKNKVAAVHAKTPWKPNYALAVTAVGLCAAQACLGFADGTPAYTAVDNVTNSTGTLLDTSDDGSYNYVWLLLMLLSIYGAYKLFSDLCAAIKTTSARRSKKATMPFKPAMRKDDIGITSAACPGTYILYSADGIKNGIYHIPDACSRLKGDTFQHRLCKDCARTSARSRRHANG